MAAGDNPTTSTTQAHDARPLLHDFEDSRKDSFTATALSASSAEDGDESSDTYCEELRPQRRPGFWTRLRMSMRRRRDGGRDGDFGGTRIDAGDKRLVVRRRRTRWCVAFPVLVVCFFGVVHILNFLLGYVPLLWDDPAASSLDWSRPSSASTDIASHLLDITHDVSPVACHSHNDYWRRVPLYDALRWGCTGVEADVWLFDQDLYVGHSTSALQKGKTFRTMYVDPLVQMLDHRNAPSDFSLSSSVKNGIFETAPEQTLVLLVDFKNDGHAIFPYVSQQLQGLREKGYLSHFNGKETVTAPITVVATGNAPFDQIIANTTYRDVFFDAPLARLYIDPTTASESHDTKSLDPRAGGQGTVGTTPSSVFDSTNSYYASAKFSRAVGFPWLHLSKHQMTLIRGQIRGAHAAGLKARYWSAPKWPVGLRNKIWRILVEEGVDYLNGDDLRGMTSLDWGVKRHWSLVG